MDSQRRLKKEPQHREQVRAMLQTLAAGQQVAFHALPTGVQLQVLKRLSLQWPILVTDDDIHLVEALVECLELAGFHTLGISDPVEALRISRTQPVAVIISDVLKEGMAMDGIELLYRVRAHPITRETPFLFLTGMDQIAGVPPSLHYDGCIYKPCDIDDLLPLIKHFLYRRMLSG